MTIALAASDLARMACTKQFNIDILFIRILIW
jgi:hypothetical protein